MRIVSYEVEIPVPLSWWVTVHAASIIHLFQLPFSENWWTLVEPIEVGRGR